MAHITTTTMIHTPPVSAVPTFRSDPSVWLPRPHRREAARRWQLALHVGALAVPVDVTIGETRKEGDALRRLIRMTPRGTSRLGSYAPALLGDIVVTSAADDLTVGLDATYRPPLGWVGLLGDRLGMRLLVAASCERLVDDIARGLTSTSEPVAVRTRLGASVLAGAAS